MGRTVWVREGRHVRVHDTQDCLSFKRSKPVSPIREVPLVEVQNPVPCRVCWPEAPRLRVWHPVCTVCGHSRPTPCPHNGAVQVLQPKQGHWTGKFGDSDYDASSLVYVRRWVWPENAFKYTLVNPGH